MIANVLWFLNTMNGLKICIESMNVWTDQNYLSYSILNKFGRLNLGEIS